MEKLSIKLHIANRIYPMKIEPSSEEFIRNAVKKIEERLTFYENNYEIKDKQDLLAMCLIEYASKLERLNNEKSDQSELLMRKLIRIDKDISSNI
ncbi:MAG: cell division protein ZapA [Flavobacteriales bacterium]|nr:cell division protein ZapA [Flavobacteriales bacterium]|tara:strand:- start:1394 stop:1678 length:285 start_codon:yes stop_codon:yes gene_type:complete